MRDPRSATAFEWDEGNEDHLAEHRVTADEIERIFEHRPIFLRNKKGRAGVWMMVGADPVSGRSLKVAICWADETEGILRAVTAFEI